jgi:menaquinone-9 beta-reductase
MAIADTPKLGAVERADVVVVGAGPGGSAAAAHLAARGRDVIVLEKDTFPRDKVCGDGLTPRVIRELLDLGLEDEAHGRAPGFKRNKGLRINGGHTTMELPWPELEDWPDWGGCSTRMVFDETIARTAVRRGAILAQGHAATRPLWRDAAESRVTGVAWKARDGREGEVLAPVVIAADGAGGPMAKHLGVQRRAGAADGGRSTGLLPLATSRRRMDQLLPRSDRRRRQPAVRLRLGLPLDDGTINVGLGLLSTSREFQAVSYRKLLESWATGMAADEWGTTPGAGGTDPLRSDPDGVQPHPAPPARCAAGRRLRRDGQPLQRRGHQLRDGGRAVGGRGRRRCVGHAPHQRSRPLRPRTAPAYGVATTPSAGCSRNWSATRP